MIRLLEIAHKWSDSCQACQCILLFSSFDPRRGFMVQMSNSSLSQNHGFNPRKDFMLWWSNFLIFLAHMEKGYWRSPQVQRFLTVVMWRKGRCPENRTAKLNHTKLKLLFLQYLFQAIRSTVHALLLFVHSETQETELVAWIERVGFALVRICMGFRKDA